MGKDADIHSDVDGSQYELQMRRAKQSMSNTKVHVVGSI